MADSDEACVGHVAVATEELPKELTAPEDAGADTSARWHCWVGGSGQEAEGGGQEFLGREHGTSVVHPRYHSRH